MLKMLSSVETFRPRRDSNRLRYPNPSIARLVGRLKQYKPTAYMAKILDHTRFDALLVDGKAKLVLDQIDPEKFEVSETSFLEEIDALFQGKRIKRMRMFEVRIPGRSFQEEERVELVIVAEAKNYRLVDRQLPLKGRPE